MQNRVLFSRSRQRFWLMFGLLTVILAAACAPAVAPTPVRIVPPQTEVSVQPTSTLLPTVTTAAPVTQVPTETPQPMATSRGPNLEASDPTTISLNNGGLQMVEFFRFT